METNNLLQHLLARGDIVSVKDGRLTIEAASGYPIPEDWAPASAIQLIREIAVRCQ